MTTIWSFLSESTVCWAVFGHLMSLQTERSEWSTDGAEKVKLSTHQVSSSSRRKLISLISTFCPKQNKNFCHCWWLQSATLICHCGFSNKQTNYEHKHQVSCSHKVSNCSCSAKDQLQSVSDNTLCRVSNKAAITLTGDQTKAAFWGKTANSFDQHW